MAKGKKGKFANAPKSAKTLRKEAKLAAEAAAANGEVSISEGVTNLKISDAEKERKIQEAISKSRIGKPTPEMYPDIVATFGTNEKKIASSAKQILVENLTVAYHGYELVKESELTLSYGNRYGLCGENGSGKSTLLRALASGMIPRPSNIDVFIVERGVDKSDRTALEEVLEVDFEKQELEAEVDRLGDRLAEDGLSDQESEEIGNSMTLCYDRLEELGADTAEAKAAGILSGLGFTKEMQNKACKDFSGGWLMRIALAKALYLNPTFLILDEPTNHLDLGAVIWFEQYLKKFDKILLLVSHSQDFLNGVCTNMLLLRGQKLEAYGGNYDVYERTRKEKETRQMKQYEYEQNQIAEMKNYIARFGHGSAKLAKQAQSKEKVLEKMMRAGLTEKVAGEKSVEIKFYPCGKLPPPVLQLSEVTFGYPNCEPLYRNVERGMDCDSRVCLVGPNGAGKSTLLKLMMGDLMPTDGMVRRHHHLKIRSYQQHTVDQLPFDKTAIEYMHSKFPKNAVSGEVNSVDQIRSMIGRFGITGKSQTMKISALSDGQRSRICFAEIAESRPNFIFLDEPTNALDPQTINALADAINKFEGGVCVVSHDIRLISQVAQEIWVCENGTISTFPGDITAFKKNLEKIVEETGSASNSLQGKGDGSKKAAPKPASKSAPKPPSQKISVASAPPKGFEGMKQIKKDDDLDWRR